MSSNVSYDLIWQVSRPYSSYLVKSSSAGGVLFSSEALNPFSLYTKTNSGFAQEQAFGVKKSGKKVQLVSKNAKKANQPKNSISVKKFSAKAHSGSKPDELIFAAATKANKLQRARGAKKN